MRRTQKEALLDLFEKRPNYWIPLPVIMMLGIAQYNARIFELRRSGHDIRNKAEVVDGQRHTYFMYIPWKVPSNAIAEGGFALKEQTISPDTTPYTPETPVGQASGLKSEIQKELFI